MFFHFLTCVIWNFTRGWNILKGLSNWYWNFGERRRNQGTRDISCSNRRASKTTLLNAIADRVRDYTGDILINNRSITKQDRRRMGYTLQQDIFFTNLTLRQTLKVFNPFLRRRLSSCYWNSNFHILENDRGLLLRCFPLPKTSKNIEKELFSPKH